MQPSTDESVEMYRVLLLDYYQMKMDEIAAHFTLARDNDVDGVHDLRVALKRLKAFFNLVGAIGDSFNAKKRFRPFKTIARTAGALRDAHVQRELVDEMNASLNLDLVAFCTYLSRAESDGYDVFRAFSDANPLEAAAGAGTCISRAIEKTSDVRAGTLAYGRFCNLRNNLVLAGKEAVLGDSALHKVRIVSKELHYTFELLQQCFHRFEDRTDFIAEIKKVHQALGKWHDYDVCLERLEDFFAISGLSSHDEPYMTFATTVRKEKDKYFRRFRSVIGLFDTVALTL